MTIRVFDLHEGRLRQIPIDTKEDLASVKPIWIDLVMPEDEHLAWAKDIFSVELPNPNDLTDLETSARFYVAENRDIHLHSDFLLDFKDESRNVAVAFVLNEDTLFSVRAKELPVFRLQRLRARAQSGYVTDAKDVLLDLYAAEVEYSANALEDVYTELEEVGRQVFKSQMTDEEAAKILAAIAAEEDLNGRIRRNVLDTRRALSFLMRGKFLSKIKVKMYAKFCVTLNRWTDTPRFCLIKSIFKWMLLLVLSISIRTKILSDLLLSALFLCR